MLRLRTVIVAGIPLLITIALAETAFSQRDAAGDAQAGIELTPIISAVIDLIFPAIAAIATYLINAHVINQQMATMLSNAVQNGLGIVQQRTAAALEGADPTVTTGRPDIDSGVRYVVAHAAEAIRHFNVPEERIAQKLTAKLGLAEIQTNLATTASAAPIIAGPLAPAPTVERIEVPARSSP